MGWRIDVPRGSFRLAEVDHLILVIDEYYPYSQPRIIAPSADSNYRWPHVEPDGFLCLRPSLCSKPTKERISGLLGDSKKLLNYPDQKCRMEFEREFTTYWARCSTPEHIPVFSLVTPHKGDRELCYFHDAKNKRFIMGDDKSTLVKWLQNSGVRFNDKDFMPTWLSCLPNPWIPAEFPECGEHVMKNIPLDNIRRPLTKDLQVPILFEAETETGAVFVAVVIGPLNRRRLIKKRGSISNVSNERILNFCNAKKIDRCKVTRLDGAWVHGRDHPSSFKLVKDRSVTIVGCGAIGSSLARLLAQAGVGELIFIDHDDLSSTNISRHLLGIEKIGYNKATLLWHELSRQFPHLAFTAFPKRFEHLSSEDLEVLSNTDLIITCGLGFDSEATLDKWRGSLQRPPAYLSTWAEAYAVAGHAVLLYGNDSILTAYDVKERFAFRLTNWPDETRVLIDEAGCGNAFQPYGVVDLYPTTGMAAKLALDHLLDRVPESCRRVWMGDPSVVNENGGEKRGRYFTDTMTILEFPWRDSP